MPRGLNIRPLSLGNLFGLSPGCGDFVACGSLDTSGASFLSSSSASTSWWHLGEWIGEVAEKADKTFDWFGCYYKGKRCRDLIKDCKKDGGLDPVTILSEAEQCQNSGRSNCADPEVNHLWACGVLDSEACQEAGKCGLNVAITGGIPDK